MDLSQYLLQKRQLICDYLKTFSDSKNSDLNSINQWAKPVIKSFSDTIPQGKMWRGCLVYLGFDLFNEKLEFDISPLGLSLEYIQTSLLIHDDIMDEDETRRGQDSLYHHYRKTLDLKVKNPLKTGMNLATCAGDYGFFCALELIAGANIDPQFKSKIMQIVTAEIAKVGLAQMDDVYFGDSQTEITEPEILNIYRYKTGRYSIGLPLVIGAILANQSDKIIADLWNIGENLGIIYQIQDDKLAIFGNSAQTGKPVGNDIKKNKKTLYRFHLYQNVTDAEKLKLNQIFGNENCTGIDLEYVKNLLSKYQIEAKIDGIIAPMLNKINKISDSLPIIPDKKQIFTEFISLMTQRKK
jgi:geranylgeranyl diphosphate synthase, type I